MPIVQETEKKKKKRSRNGCLSCKQLKIKCDEGKPSCEYCIHTQRQCVYATTARASKNRTQSNPLHFTNKAPLLDASSSSLSPTAKTTPFLVELDSINASPSTTTTTTATTPSPFDEQRSPSQILFGGQLSPRTKAILLQRGKEEYEPPTHVDFLTRSLVLNQASSMLGISRFELRLLNFFDMHCVNLFSFGVNEGIHNAWKYKVPHLFLESELVRQSMFSFAAVALGTTISLEEVRESDNKEKRARGNHEDEDIFDALLKEDTYDFDTMTKSNIYMKTTTHFLNTLAKAQEKINQVSASNSYSDPSTAKELTVSSILIFSFLGVQPHGLIKLISFNKEGLPPDEQETDMISVSRASRDVLLNCASTVFETELSGLLFFRVNQDLYSPPLKECQYPIIKYLLQGLYEFQDTSIADTDDNEVTINDTSSQYHTLQLTLDCLTKALFGCGYYKFPIPLFRFLMVIPEHFRQLLYSKHPYALKILYVYSCLCFVGRFQMYKNHNIWRDFVIWYGGTMGLNDDVERKLCSLVINEQFVVPNYEEFPCFDPMEVDAK
ncbi:hypothetical protein I9W82_001682 [Candida metapsilosis]|uniref:Zn(2)-C6 fungal-type domain-containing protein n=1 Tax=Candida metapsilosis TaxID=273372 RepID=A0A8H7ZD99_9ASCO|nr:hypothetical protein I9W82_001682 [Candida metapsilosis]